MNALIKKEIRLLLPAWIAAMLLGVFSGWIISAWSDQPANASSIYATFGLASFLGFLFLGISSFGQEFSFGTFSFLLSQPIPRRRVWLIKTTVLAVAFILVLLGFIVSWQLREFYFSGRLTHAPDFLNCGDMLYAAAFFSGGLWTTLLLRQMTGAFWFTLLMPLAIIVIIGTSLEDFVSSGRTTAIIVEIALAIYSIAGFFLARHFFLNAQDTQWTGGEISFPWRRKNLEQTAASFSSPPCHWFSALVRKEFQLHQANILIAALVLVLHLTSIFIRKVHPYFQNPDVKFILEFVWALWLLMPLLIGSAAVAEERRLGIIESQLCLPVSRRMQLFIKFSVGLILSVILGAVMPLLVEGPKHFTDHPQDFVFVFWIPAMLIFFISFYASTLSRTTLQAIGITIGLIGGIWFVFFGMWFGYGRFHSINVLMSPYQEMFITYLTLGILLLVLVWLTFGNFKRLYENKKLWLRNVITIALSLAFNFTLANAIYFRAWELLTPIEPSHGPARLNDSNPAKLAVHGNCISAILPDGRLWIEMLAFDQKTNRWMGQFEKLAPDRSKAQFIDGSNWTEVAPQWYETLAIKSDGTLWNLQGKWDHSYGWIFSKLTQMGSETNWSHAATGNQRYFLLLKNNGSLWLWGTNQVRSQANGLAIKLAADLATPPTRIGDETNWSGLFSLNSVYARKTDGTFWTQNLEWNGTNAVYHFIQNTNLNDRSPNFVSFNDAYSAEVKTNGELWFSWNNWTHNKFVPGGKIQFGKNAKWKSVTFVNYNSVIALRSDGTLWKWSPIWDLMRNPNLIKAVQLGNHSDWISFSSTSYPRDAIALAADGSLWLWDEPSAHVWLAPSRKPVFIGNIFQGMELKAE